MSRAIDLTGEKLKEPPPEPAPEAQPLPQPKFHSPGTGMFMTTGAISYIDWPEETYQQTAEYWQSRLAEWAAARSPSEEK